MSRLTGRVSRLCPALRFGRAIQIQLLHNHVRQRAILAGSQYHAEFARGDGALSVDTVRVVCAGVRIGRYEPCLTLVAEASQSVVDVFSFGSESEQLLLGVVINHLWWGYLSLFIVNSYSSHLFFSAKID